MNPPARALPEQITSGKVVHQIRHGERGTIDREIVEVRREITHQVGEGFVHPAGVRRQMRGLARPVLVDENACA